ncbi:hypothetical protein CR513_56961, partial [Mucuna pruriens]
MVNEISVVDNLRLENQLTELTSVCGICTSMEHPTNMCHILQEAKLDYPESVGAIGGYQYEKQLAESRAIYSSTIWTCPECTSRTNRLLTIDSAISGTTVQQKQQQTMPA